MVKRLDEDPAPVHLLAPEVSPRLSELLMSMLAREPERRLDTYDELVESLLSLLSDSDRKNTNATVGNVIRRRTSFWRMTPNKLFR